jgi:CheY-like chemotaxis protein
MSSLAEFETQLQEMLAHLYDPLYRPPALLRQRMGIRETNSREGVGSALQAVLEQLKPPADTPPTARIWRMYRLLVSRYVHELTQKETALRLGITPRHLRREQQQAVHWLAQHLWTCDPRASDDEPPDDPATTTPEANPVTWHDQLQAELLALHQYAPGTVADVASAVASVAALGQAVTAKPAITFAVSAAPPELAVALHPSVLRQLLIAAVEKLAGVMHYGRIDLSVSVGGDEVIFHFAGQPAIEARLPESEFIRTILAAQGGALSTRCEGDQLIVDLALPASNQATVLVVDDNTDLVRFYRRYVEGTRYQIAHVREGSQVLPAVAQVHPQAIVLDVLLPDVDGWQLLMALHKDPATQMIPIIVCSVIRRAELALSLGATEVLVKPVHRQDFIRALDQVLLQEKRPTRAGAGVVVRD